MPADLEGFDLKKQSQFKANFETTIESGFGLGTCASVGFSSAYGSYFPCAAGWVSLEYAKIIVNNLNVTE